MKKCILCGKDLVYDGTYYWDCPKTLINCNNRKITHFYETNINEKTIVLKNGFIITDQFGIRYLIDDGTKEGENDLRVSSLKELTPHIDPVDLEAFQNFLLLS